MTPFNTRSPAVFHPLLLSALGPLLALAFARPAAPLPGGGIENGDFSRGFQGWTLEPARVTHGEAAARGVARVVSQTPSVTFAGPHAYLLLRMRADGSSQPSNATAAVTIRTTGIVRGTQLKLRAARGGGSTFGGEGLEEYRMEVFVRGTGPAAGRQASLVLDQSTFAWAGPCSILASGSVLTQGEHTLDLAGSGLAPGDPVEIQVRLSGHVSAALPCGARELISTLYVDDLRFE